LFIRASLEAGGVKTTSTKEEHRMKLHGNAELSLNKRRVLARRIVEEGWPPAKAARSAEVTARTARKWADRYREEGEAGLLDRPSAPRLKNPHEVLDHLRHLPHGCRGGASWRSQF
jgi:transposase